MQDEITQASVADREDSNDRTLLQLLLEPAHGHGIWHVEELGRELGDQSDAVDSVIRLAAGGLVHQLQGFVFATRAAKRLYGLVEA